MPALTKKFTLADLRKARTSGEKFAMLTCYDFTTARLMSEAGVPILLVGDTAAEMVLGHNTTLPVPFRFMMELAQAVRRGVPNALVVADMPFGSYLTPEHGLKNVARMAKHSNCDIVKIEVGEGHLEMLRRLADAGVAVMAHIGLRPQSVGLLGKYRYQGRTADEAQKIVELARTMESAGVAALLLEAVPPEVGDAVVKATGIPVIGCGAGPACHGHVVVTQDLLNMTAQRPRFVPQLADVAACMKTAFSDYVRVIADGTYPAPEHQYEMSVEEKARFLTRKT